MLQDPASSKEPFGVNGDHIVKFWSSVCQSVVVRIMSTPRAKGQGTWCLYGASYIPQSACSV